LEFSTIHPDEIYLGMPHLTEMEIAQYVDALVAEKQDQLPKGILEHVEECLECKKEVIEILDLIWTIEKLDSLQKQ